MPLVKFRQFGDRPAPQPIKITVPGWAGDKAPRADGQHEQPWHCIPFSESARYGLELVYPYDVELRVTTRNGRVHLDADWGEPPESMGTWPPFRTFGDDYYSYQLSLDLDVPPGFAVRTEPHPRYFTDPTYSTPLAVPALIRTEWWPMIFFCIFRAPPPGVTHVFRKDEPFIAFTILPADPTSRSSPWTRRPRFNARCAAAGSRPAATSWPRARAGHPTRIRFSTAPIAIWPAPRAQKPRGKTPGIERFAQDEPRMNAAFSRQWFCVC